MTAAGQPDLALRVLERAVAEDPSNGILRVVLVNILKEFGSVNRLESELEALIQCLEREGLGQTDWVRRLREDLGDIRARVREGEQRGRIPGNRG